MAILVKSIVPIQGQNEAAALNPLVLDQVFARKVFLTGWRSLRGLLRNSWPNQGMYGSTPWHIRRDHHQLLPYSEKEAQRLLLKGTVSAQRLKDFSRSNSSFS